ncbi:hypothetical protein EXIGLDRAFT_410281 [Exidia glandulosa HHB12029]|uniref:F-box domain-containing protein n=1 Tax=Exidia glandulosa HHB12029 TaxID=1314781 RepID=A0A165BG29_EXIGL|nr:hypothetical protein EXIGLDRAFT_410281 [Exidia glandulosa HHB12029]
MPTTCAIDVLYVELLADIMHLVDPGDIRTKFVLSRVCAHWRAVALATPLLWAVIRVATAHDADALPVVLARAGHATSLAVSLEAKAMRTRRCPLVILAPFIPRIRCLRVRCSTSTFLPPILGQGVEFPALEQLHVDGPDAAILSGQWPVVDLRAPRLKRLYLSHVAIRPDGWTRVLSTSLRQIYVISCHGGHIGALSTIFVQCPSIQLVVIRQKTWDRSPIRLKYSALRGRVPPSLRYLTISGDEQSILLAVNSDVDTSTVQRMHVNLREESTSTHDVLRGHVRHFVDELGGDVFSGVDRSRQSLKLRNGRGHSRSIKTLYMTGEALLGVYHDTELPGPFDLWDFSE